jgi:hypothetical protein
MDRFVFREYSMPFIVYTHLDNWPIYDLIAKYGHIVNSLIIVYIAINVSVSFFMAWNIGCVCYYYFVAIRRLGKKALALHRLSGL